MVPECPRENLLQLQACIFHLMVISTFQIFKKKKILTTFFTPIILSFLRCEGIFLYLQNEKLTAPTATTLVQETFTSNMEYFKNLKCVSFLPPFFILTKHSVKSNQRDPSELAILLKYLMASSGQNSSSIPHFIRGHAKVLTEPTGLSVISFLWLYSFLPTLLQLLFAFLFFIV